MAESKRPLPAVVIPVYNAAEALEACLASVAATLPAGSAVRVIDDASPDDSVRTVLGRWAGKAMSGWRFERNPTNLGFVATANRGMEMTLGDVVLLNSDTVVTPGWLQGLARCLDSDAAIGTATPWTNNGEIASLPEFCRPNPVPPDAAAIASVLQSAGAPIYPVLPTAVGFCMAISRRAIETVGVFDADTFGRGYGEENDFSMRVAEAGMRNVLCDDVYVVHVGGCSFGPLGLRPGEESMQRLLSRHPGYLQQVQQFIAEDPLRDRREAVISALQRAGVGMR